MVLDSLKGVAAPRSVRLMWQSTISMGENFLVELLTSLLEFDNLILGISSYNKILTGQTGFNVTLRGSGRFLYDDEVFNVAGIINTIHLCWHLNCNVSFRLCVVSARVVSA